MSQSSPAGTGWAGSPHSHGLGKLLPTTCLIVPNLPVRTNSQERRLTACERCWLPTWKTRLYLRAASTISRPSRIVKLRAFSAYTSLPAWQAWIVTRARQWSGVAVTIASTSLRSSSLRSPDTPRRRASGTVVRPRQEHVGDADAAAVLKAQCALQHAGALAPDADPGDPDAVVGARLARRGQHAARNQVRQRKAGGTGDGATAEKLATGVLGVGRHRRDPLSAGGGTVL